VPQGDPGGGGKETPGVGEITIFNRSHYEDVLVVRVHDLVPEKTWRARYDQINDWERMLAANRTIILKFFLHISKEEQEERQQGGARGAAAGPRRGRHQGLEAERGRLERA